ncbi:hypothetical protein [Methanocaldococcus sp.]
MEIFGSVWDCYVWRLLKSDLFEDGNELLEGLFEALPFLSIKISTSRDREKKP